MGHGASSKEGYEDAAAVFVHGRALTTSRSHHEAGAARARGLEEAAARASEVAPAASQAREAT